jgi:hypothetical protein
MVQPLSNTHPQEKIETTQGLNGAEAKAGAGEQVEFS